MSKNAITSIVVLGFLFLSVACDKVCNKTVEDFATVQNTTGRQLNLSVCKGHSYGEVQAVVLMDNTSNEVSLGSHQEDDIKGGMDAVGACSSSNSKSAMGISLSPNSFGQVKLCQDQASTLYVVVEASQTCPTGMLEQTSTSPCNGN